MERPEHGPGADRELRTGVVLARTVFGPEAFGLYAVSQVILAVLLSANEMGVSLAIVRWDGDVRAFAGTVFTLSVASSSPCFTDSCTIAPFARQPAGFSRRHGHDQGTEPMRLIDGLACVPLALLTRSSRSEALWS